MDPRNANIFKHLITGIYFKWHTWPKHGVTFPFYIWSLFWSQWDLQELKM